MTAAPENDRIDCQTELRKLIQRYVPEGSETRNESRQRQDARFAFFSSAIVFARSQRMSHHGIADYQPHVRRKRQLASFERPAVQENGAIRAGVAGRELIHDAATDSGEFVFRSLAQKRNLSPVHRDSGISE